MNIINASSLLNKRGVTLVEALIAAFIMAIGIFGVQTVIYSQFSSLNQNREKAIATLSAQEEIENIRGMPFDSILALGSSFNASGFAYLKNPSGEVVLDNIYGSSNIKRVSVTVSWDSVTGSRRNRKLVTVITRGGVDKQ